MPDGALRRPVPALPVAVIGAGPVGLAAASHLLERGLQPVVLEAGRQVAAAVRDWGHVRLFSPWEYCVDDSAERLLRSVGWSRPDAGHCPTGAELVDRYVAPLAALPALSRVIRTDSRVVAVSRHGHDRMRDGGSNGGRAEAPFVLRIRRDGGDEDIAASAVIDCSGTWSKPNPMGAHGLTALGEAAAAASGLIEYGIPDILGTDRDRYAGKDTLVVGGGHSAMNAVLDLARLAEQVPGTRVRWALRRPFSEVRFGGGSADALPERGALGGRAAHLVRSGVVDVVAPFQVVRVSVLEKGRMRVESLDGGSVAADRIIVAAGFRPDLEPLSELRLGLDPALESTPALAPMIDPNVHSCGTVPPHGEAALRHPEPGFWMAGMKSYGRAPTFLLRTGYEQVRSIAAWLAGDMAAAAEVRLVLPETGACGGAPESAAACCTPLAQPAEACCVEAAAMAAGTPAGTCCPPAAEAGPARACCG